MAHRMVMIETGDRQELPWEIRRELPTPIPSLADPERLVYAYRAYCACGEVELPWVSSSGQAIETWVEHALGENVKTEEDRRDEIVRLVDQMGGLNWLRSLVKVNDMLFENDTTAEVPCADCGCRDVCPPECGIQKRPMITEDPTT
jgi:hypothetical protein